MIIKHGLPFSSIYVIPKVMRQPPRQLPLLQSAQTRLPLTTALSEPHKTSETSETSEAPISSSHDNLVTPVTLLTRSDWLSEQLEYPVILCYTKNKRTLLSARPPACLGDTGHTPQQLLPLEIRINLCFSTAPENLWLDLVQWLSTLDLVTAIKPPSDFSPNRLHSYLVKHAIYSPRRDHNTKYRIPIQGQFHHLGELMQTLQVRYFPNLLGVSIGWGQKPQQRKKPRRSMQLGSYHTDMRHIRIHRALDQGFVPIYYLRWVIFHEMLHAFLGVKTIHGKRREVHSPTFRKLEKSYPEYQRAAQWENRYLPRLLAFATLDKNTIER